jgi:hypothetical protein
MGRLRKVGSLDKIVQGSTTREPETILLQLGIEICHDRIISAEFGGLMKS